MDTEYINRKIENLQNLLLDCTEDQKIIYQGYLEFWQEKIPKSKEKPDAETIEEEGNLLITEEVFNVEAEIIDIIEIDPIEEEHQAELFEATFPNKRAYLRRNGDLLKTKAFKEFLIKE